MKRSIALILVLSLALMLSISALADSRTVYYYNSEGFDTVMVYTWEPNEQWGSWPGGDCKDLGGGWWSVEVPVYNDKMPIIFNNGNGGEGNQTSNLEISGDNIFFYGNNSEGDGGLSAADAEAKFGSLPAGVGGSSSGGGDTVSNVKTGDSFVIFGALALLVLAGAGFVVLKKKRV